MPKKPTRRNVPFNQVLEALLDDRQTFPGLYLHQFSDLEGPDLETLKSTWNQIIPDRRLALLEDLENLAEEEMIVSFDAVASFALSDSDPRVRRTAVNLLWECEDLHLVPVFIKMLKQDADENVRSAAATALGQFIYLGELEEIPEKTLHQIEDVLLAVIQGQDTVLVRRHALESMGFSSRSEVPALITRAYESGEQEWLVSSLFAMGRSADDRWEPEVKRMINHPEAEVQVEAVRAAGELELSSTRRSLLALLEDELVDEEVYYQAVWALSKIGGDDVRETLESLLENAEEDEDTDFIEQALENLTFTEGLDPFEMFEMYGGDMTEEVASFENADRSHGFDNLPEDQAGEEAEDDQKPEGRPSEKKHHQHNKKET